MASIDMSHLTVLRSPYVSVPRIIIIAILLLVTMATAARANYREFKAIPTDNSLVEKLWSTAEAALKEFPQLNGNLALSVIDMTKPDSPMRADYNGDAPFYPASVIKLFFMVEIFRENRLSPEIDRALHEMIENSDNDAASYLVDVISNTTSGPELQPKAFNQFIDRRRVINRRFASLGYDINAMGKPMSFSPYGRDLQLLGPNKENRNRASANSVASILCWMVRRHAISHEASDKMLQILERPLDPPRPNENQIKDFFGESLPPGTKLWSKSGDTSEVRHDAAYVELPNGRKFIAVIFTRIGDEKRVVPAVGRLLLENVFAKGSR